MTLPVDTGIPNLERAIYSSMMGKIHILTLNPVLDKDTSVAGIVPHGKLRCASLTYYPGGGGLHVSRALKKLGGSSQCFYLAGGLGTHLKDLITTVGIDQIALPIEGWTRENLSVTDTQTNLQYRFGEPGPFVQEKEWKKTLNLLDTHLKEGDYLGASGKLPPGIPDDYYARITPITNIHFYLPRNPSKPHGIDTHRF